MPSSLPDDSPFRAGVLPETQVLLAGQDLLTGLSSRAGLDAHFRLAVARARRSGARFAVGIAVIGVDPAVPPDEVFGHVLLVVEAAKRLRAVLRETDLVARLGETRFAFVAEEVAPDGAASIVERVLRTLQESSRTSSGSARPLVGLALWEHAEQTLPLLLRLAERALTAETSDISGRPTAANAATFGAQDDADLPPSRSVGQRVLRRGLGWLSLATLVVLALSATPSEWRGRWLPLERFAQQGWNELQIRLPWGAQAIDRP
ncbi:MAG TPA: diguanylate cyclase [Burkholderiaceae bacterium]|nr:diguanylate cyclase [Burkholderiaceae bacterium]